MGPTGYREHLPYFRVCAPSLEGLAGRLQCGLRRIAGGQVNRGCRTQLYPVRQVNLDPYTPQRADGSVFDGARKSIIAPVIGNNQPRPAPPRTLS